MGKVFGKVKKIEQNLTEISEREETPNNIKKDIKVQVSLLEKERVEAKERAVNEYKEKQILKKEVKELIEIVDHQKEKTKDYERLRQEDKQAEITIYSLRLNIKHLQDKVIVLEDKLAKAEKLTNSLDSKILAFQNLQVPTHTPGHKLRFQAPVQKEINLEDFLEDEEPPKEKIKNKKKELVFSGW